MSKLSHQQTFSFDFLEKIEHTSVLNSVFSKMEIKLFEAKAKSTKADFSEQEKMISDLRSIYVWTCALFEEKELMYRHNLNLERISLELQAKVNELKKQVETLNKIDSL